MDMPSIFDQVIAHPFLQRIQKGNFIFEWLLRSPLWPLRKAIDRQFTRSQAAAELIDRWFFDGLNCDQLPERRNQLLIVLIRCGMSAKKKTGRCN